MIHAHTHIERTQNCRGNYIFCQSVINELRFSCQRTILFAKVDLIICTVATGVKPTPTLWRILTDLVQVAQ